MSIWTPLTLTLSSLALVACAEGPTNQAQQETVQKAASNSTPIFLGPAYQKPGAPLELTHAIVKPVDVNETARIDLRVKTRTDATRATVMLTSQTGLSILGASTRTVTFDDGVAIFAVDVRSDVEGRHYLDVVAELDGIGARTMSVAVQVGEGGALNKVAPGTVVMDDDNQPIMVMEDGVTETINGVKQTTTSIDDE